MFQHLHEAYQALAPYLYSIIATWFIYLVLDWTDRMYLRVKMAEDRKNRCRNGLVLYADRIPGTNGYRIITRVEGYHVHR